MARPLPRNWFKQNAAALAPRLLGKTLRRGRVAGIIVEVEAYEGDAASHARVLTERSRIMHETYGHWYVYFTYGMHWCLNVTAGETPGGILIRAVEPTEGVSLMKRRRGITDLRRLARGPGNVGQAFGVTKKDYGLPVADDFAIEDAPDLPASCIATGPRIGIREAKELPWRFWITDNPYVSRN